MLQKSSKHEQRECGCYKPVLNYAEGATDETDPCKSIYTDPFHLWLLRRSVYGVDGPPAAPFIIASRLALNSDPTFHSGYLSPCTTRYPIIISNCASSIAPVRSQSGLISSETLW